MSFLSEDSTRESKLNHLFFLIPRHQQRIISVVLSQESIDRSGEERETGHFSTETYVRVDSRPENMGWKIQQGIQRYHTHTLLVCAVALVLRFRLPTNPSSFQLRVALKARQTIERHDRHQSVREANKHHLSPDTKLLTNPPPAAAPPQKAVIRFNVSYRKKSHGDILWLLYSPLYF